MNVVATLIIGGGVHALVSTGVFFAKEEPYNVQISGATTLTGLLVALLIAFSLEAGASHTLSAGAGYGFLYGSTFGMVVFLAKGGNFRTAPHLLSGSVIQGVLTGLLVLLFAL